MSPQIWVMNMETEALVAASDVRFGGSEEDGVTEVREQDSFSTDIWGN